jgi:hypothetical protein
MGMLTHEDQACFRAQSWRKKPPRAGTLLAIVFIGAQCAPVIKRDISTVPAGRVGFDDMCGLQTYFDRLAMKIGNPPLAVSSIDLQGKGHLSGRARYAFETDVQLQAIRQVLNENWRRLPDDVATAPRIDIEVQWSERSGVRRVVMDRDADLIIGRTQTSLPYHVCLSELLFGEPLYKERRVALGLGALPSPPPLIPAPADGGAKTDARVDGGASPATDGGARGSAAPTTSAASH